MRLVITLVLALALASAASAASVGRIVGGQEASISQFPYMANLLQSQDFSFYMPACGGAIISSRSILTTASCLPDSPSLVRARVGSSNASSGGTVLTISSITWPAAFNPISLESDIAIIKTVEGGITFVSNAVMPIGYAPLTSVLPDDSVVTIAGWGRSEFGPASEQLRHIQVKTMNNRDCDTASSSNVYIPYNMFCTTRIDNSFPSADACVGDNGSPVVLNNVVVGLVAHPRCNYFRPSVHTRVSSFQLFIQSNL